MFYIGCHLSSSKGYVNMGNETLSIGGSTFQFFTRNPRGGQSKPLDRADTEGFNALAAENGFGKIIAHAPYTMNPCAEKPDILRFTKEIMADDLARLESTPGNLYNFHPGSHVGQGVDVGIKLITETLDAIMTEEMHTTILLETMSGKGSEVGSRFEELREIIDRTALGSKLGVCLDTCHVSDAGYDIIGNLDGVLDEFDRVIGIDRLKAIHLNDSKNPMGAHKDRHEKIGQGFIGIDAIAKVINHPLLKDLPFVLETPHDDLEGYKNEITLLKSLRN